MEPHYLHAVHSSAADDSPPSRLASAIATLPIGHQEESSSPLLDQSYFVRVRVRVCVNKQTSDTASTTADRTRNNSQTSNANYRCLIRIGKRYRRRQLYNLLKSLQPVNPAGVFAANEL